MSRKLQGNGMWESSRIILPEHRIRINADRRKVEEREVASSRYCLDEFEMEENIRLLNEASQHDAAVEVTLYDPSGNVTVSGFVVQFDTYAGRLRIAHDDSKTWIPFRDILKVEEV